MLIASYCWTQDAERIGALIHSDGTAEPELMDLVFRDLAAVHGVQVCDITKYYQGEYFAWDWLHNPMTMGLFFFQATNSIHFNGYFRRLRILWPQRV